MVIGLLVVVFTTRYDKTRIVISVVLGSVKIKRVSLETKTKVLKTRVKVITNCMVVLVASSKNLTRSSWSAI